MAVLVRALADVMLLATPLTPASCNVSISLSCLTQHLRFLYAVAEPDDGI